MTVGRIAGLFGVRGWVKVYSHTEPRENILEYQPWLLEVDGEMREYRVVDGRAHGKGIVAQLEGVETCDDAAALVGTDVAVTRDAFGPARAGEYYYADLEGVDVVTAEDVHLGRVSHLFETGANAVMVVKGERERLVPFTSQAVLDVDLDARRITVDWDPEF